LMSHARVLSQQEAFGLALRGQTGCLREAMDGAVPNSKPLGWH